MEDLTNSDIIEALSSIEPIFCDEFVSVTEAWNGNGDHLDLGYIYDKWDKTEPFENKEKVKKMVEFLKRKINENKLIILD